MPGDVKIPTLGESVTEGVIVRWIKADGATVKVDDPLLELETDKASVELPAPAAGVLRILKQEGAKVQVGETVARIEEGAAQPAEKKPAAAEKKEAPAEEKPAAAERKEASTQAKPAAAEKKEAPAEGKPAEAEKKVAVAAPEQPAAEGEGLSPAVRRLLEEKQLEPSAIQGTGRGGRLTKGDVLAYLEAAPTVPPSESPPSPVSTRAAAPEPAPAAVAPARAGEAERVPMSRLRQRIAERLVQAQHTAAILTTFNEIDMSAVLELRTRYKARFAEVHGVPLGFMSFFARACIAALRSVPVVGARIEGTDIVYNKHVNLGIAVGTERGLVVPVVHNAEAMTFAEIEKEIERLAGLARQNKLSIEDLSGGTFTISNGGIYGSLLSTPILNPPQSGILGMHKIEKRPVVVDDQIVVRPMMYVALSYDHRLIDGKEAVTFLVRVKEAIEDPTRLLLDL